MIGCGSMGGGMALLFAENGIEVGLQDPSQSNMDHVLEQAKKDGLSDRVKKYTDYDSLTANLGKPKVFVFSLPHGSVGDSVLSQLMPYLKKGDIIIDAGNEHWKNTERRQGKCAVRGIRYVGMGVSGGYQAARRGPSMCPGGDDESLDIVLPLLRKVAAKDKHGKPCVGKAGLGGSGHYVKMVHNGIEHGMMSAIAEAWQIMEVGLGIDEDEMSKIFAKWNDEGELKNMFLIEIGVDILAQKKPEKPNEHLLPIIQDKVVQDITGEEGTGIWSNEEAISEHVPAPTLNIAHDLRLASAYRANREKSKAVANGGWPQQKGQIAELAKDKFQFIEELRKAVFIACVASYVQGIQTIMQADSANGWSINLLEVLQIWRAGCIIRTDYIGDLLEPIFQKYEEHKSQQRNLEENNLLFEEDIAKEWRKCFQALKSVVLKATEADAIIPALSATLEYIKFQTNTSKFCNYFHCNYSLIIADLPTQFYEAELDFFGSHMFDIKGEKGTGGPTEGKHHFEWRPA
jgi:6-phosphogluconate dehydrogenase